MLRLPGLALTVAATVALASCVSLGNLASGTQAPDAEAPGGGDGDGAAASVDGGVPEAAGAVDAADKDATDAPAPLTCTTERECPSGDCVDKKCVSDTILLAEDFSSGTVPTTSWNVENQFSGSVDTAMTLAVRMQRLEVDLLQNTTNSHYDGITSVAKYDFTGARVSVEIAAGPASNTAGNWDLTVGTGANDYYRYFIESGSLRAQKRIAGVKTDVSTIAYDPVVTHFVRIRHDAAGDTIVYETAPLDIDRPGAWTEHARITREVASGLANPWQAELRAGTYQVEANPPGTVAFDTFKLSR